MPARYPERIVCLTEETTETLYLLGEERRHLSDLRLQPCGRAGAPRKAEGVRVPFGKTTNLQLKPTW